MRAEDATAVCALVGVDLPADRAAAIAADLARLAERLRRAPLQPTIDDLPTDFTRALR